MSKLNNRLINFDGQNLFKVLAGASFTVPEFVTRTSPTSFGSSGLTGNPGSTVGRGQGGGIFAAFHNDAGSVIAECVHPLKAGDVVACSAIASNAFTVSINGTVVQTISGTTVTAGGILGYYN